MKTIRLALAPLLVAVSSIAIAQPAKPGAEMLLVGEFLPPGGHLLSQNKKFVGAMERDGRFCVYEGTGPTAKTKVVRCAPHAPQAAGDYFLQVRDDGNLCVVRGAQPPGANPVCFPGSARPKGQHFAVMMNSGGFELYPGRGWSPTSNVAYWTMARLPAPAPAPAHAPPTPPGSTAIQKGKPPVEPPKPPPPDKPTPPPKATVTLTITPPTTDQASIRAAVGSHPAAPNCRAGAPAMACAPLFKPGDTVTVTAVITPTSGLQFKAWGAACAGQPAECKLKMDGDRAVSVELAAAKPTPAPTPAPAPAAPVAAAKGYLVTGEALITGHTLQSPGKKYYATQQADGNLCVYGGTPSAPKAGPWCHHKVGPGGQFVTVVQTDGNLCTYRGTSATTFQHGATWCTNAVSSGGQFVLVMQDDGNLCVYKGTNPGNINNGLWCHNTNVEKAPLPPIPYTVPPRNNQYDTLAIANGTRYGLWVTVRHLIAPLVANNIASGCVRSGDEGYFNVNGLVAGKSYEIQAEMTSTADCSSRPNNSHVICKTTMAVQEYNGYYYYFTATLRGEPGGCFWDGGPKRRP